MGVAGKVEFGYWSGWSEAAESRDLELRSRMQKEASALEF